MLDRTGIYERFASCYEAKRSAQLARVFNVPRQTTNMWKTGLNPIPLRHCKTLIDTQNLTWDWLLEGREPKFRQDRKGKTIRPLDCHSINQRFLALFPDMSQAAIAKELGINQTTVFKWFHDLTQVSLKRLKYAVDTKGVTWEWLLEGR